MSWRIVAVGNAIATFLVVGALVTGSLAGWTEFSALVGIPAGLVAAVAAVLWTYRGTRADSPDLLVRGLTGVAGFAYAAIALMLLRYAVAATRPYLAGAGPVAVAGLVVGVLAAALVPSSDVRPGG